MPKAIKSNLSRRMRAASKMAVMRSLETDEQHSQRNELTRQRNSRAQLNYVEEEQMASNTVHRLRMRRNRAVRDRSDEIASEENLTRRIRRQQLHTGNLQRAAFQYNESRDYSLHASVIIGTMNKVCQHYSALKFSTETSGIFCANGKINLTALNSPPEPLRSLVSGISSESKHFQMYNSSFQMTSFGATNLIGYRFMPTFKIQGQIYHRAGSLLPPTDTDYKFLQIYFMGNSPQELDRRCANSKMHSPHFNIVSSFPIALLKFIK